MSSRLRVKLRSNSRKLLIKIRISEAIPNIVGHQPDTFRLDYPDLLSILMPTIILYLSQVSTEYVSLTKVQIDEQSHFF